MKKIAFFGNTLWSMYNFRRHVICAIKSVGYDVVIFAPADTEYELAFQNLGIKCHAISMSRKSCNPLHDLWLYMKVLWCLHHERIDLLFCYTIKPNIWGGLAAATLHIPFIAFVCGLGHSMIRNGYLFRIIKYLYTFSFRFAYEVWFINSDDRQIMEEHKIIRHEKSRLLKGEGIDCSRFSCSASCSERFIFLLSARMLWEKGIAEFVKAAGILKERYPGIRCQLLGFVDSGNPSGITRETLELWSKDGCVEYLGSVSDVVPFVEAADCIVLPSYYREGIPFSLLEGAAAGKPLIAAQSPGCTEVVLENVTGFLCKPRDAEDLAEKMEKLLLLPLSERRKMGMQGRKLVEEAFSINKIIPQYLQVISVVFSDQKQG